MLHYEEESLADRMRNRRLTFKQEGFFPRHCSPENLGGRKVSIVIACNCDHIVKNYLNNVEECIDAHTEAIFQ